jgi:hypothetical protein
MYGYEIVKAIQVQTHEVLTFGEGCIYPYLHYLEKAKLVDSRRQDVAGRLAALIERDFQKAYGWFGDSGKTVASLDQFTDALKRSHPAAFPLSVNAIEYEPIPGQRGMNIYLYGENGDVKFYYRFAMEGVKETGYKVAGFWRHDGPYPASSQRRRLDESL